LILYNTYIYNDYKFGYLNKYTLYLGIHIIKSENAFIMVIHFVFLYLIYSMNNNIFYIKLLYTINNRGCNLTLKCARISHGMFDFDVT